MMRVVGLLLALCVFGLSGYNAWAADAGNEQFLKIITEQENALKLLEAGDYEKAMANCDEAEEILKGVIDKLKIGDPLEAKVRESAASLHALKGDVYKAWGMKLAQDVETEIASEAGAADATQSAADAELARAEFAGKVLAKINDSLEKLSKARMLLKDVKDVNETIANLEKQRIKYDGMALTVRERTRRDELFKNADEQYILGRNLYKEGKYEEADEQLEASKKSLQEISEQFGRAASTADKVSKKLATIEALRADLHVDWAKHIIVEAKKLVDAKDVDEAIAKLNLAVEIDPSREEQIDKMREAFIKEKDNLEFKQETTLENIMPDTKQNEFDIRVKIDAGIVLMKNGRYADARDSFETVLIADPYNLTAIRYLQRISDELKKIADERREQIFHERLAEVRWKWAEPVTPLLAGPSGDLSARALKKNSDDASLQNRLDNIIFPEFKIQDEPLIDVLEKIRQKAKQYDTNGGEGINFVIQLKRIQPNMAAAGNMGMGGGMSGEDMGMGGGMSMEPGMGGGMGMDGGMGGGMGMGMPGGGGMGGGMGGMGEDGDGGMNMANMGMPAGGGFDTMSQQAPSALEDFSDQPVNMEMSNASLATILQYISLVTGVKLKIDSNAVVINHPDNQMERLELRFYNVEAGFLDTNRTKKRMSKLTLSDDDD
ncbi:MAG: hypothetical protein IKS67_14025, partial [Victivallales bacterium]|nr:hypothetical protein [Victivallales bacterium]